MKVILARASCIYKGRIDAELSLGDVCIMIREEKYGGDGSVLIHDMLAGIPAKNWMPAGSVMTKTEGGYKFIHEKREEELEIYIEKIYKEIEHKPQLKTVLSKLGAEKEFSDLIAQHLELLPNGKDILSIQREYRTSAGPIDLLCEYEYELTAIEVKRRNIDLSAVWQLKRYIDALSTQYPTYIISGLLIAPHLAKAAKEFLEDENNIKYLRINYKELKLEHQKEVAIVELQRK